MFNVNFDVEELRDVIREEVRAAVRESMKMQQLPPFLTRVQMMDVLHIGATKAAELMARPDFPVCREAGVLIPTKMLFEWIERHTQWVQHNTDYFSAS